MLEATCGLLVQSENPIGQMLSQSPLKIKLPDYIILLQLLYIHCTEYIGRVEEVGFEPRNFESVVSTSMPCSQTAGYH